MFSYSTANKIAIKCILFNCVVQFGFSRWMSVVGRRPSPVTSTEPRFERRGASVLRSYLSHPSTLSLVSLGSLCVPEASRTPHDQPNSHLSLLIISMISRTLVFCRIHWAVLRSRHMMSTAWSILSGALCVVLSFKVCCFTEWNDVNCVNTNGMSMWPSQWIAI